MRKLILIATCLLFISSLKSQQLYLEAGKTISSFDFKNSLGGELENLRATDHTFLSLGYRKSVFTERLFLNVTGNYSTYGSIGSDRALDNFFEWDITYIGINAGFDYEFYKPGDFTFYIKTTAAAEFLIQGTQTLNNQVFNLAGEDDFDTPIYFFRGGLGVQYKVSQKLTAFTQYMYGIAGTFKDIQGDLKINAHTFGLGLLIHLSKVEEHKSEELINLKEEVETNTQKIKELEDKSKQITDLRNEIRSKEEEIKSLRTSISKALLPYTGNELATKKDDGSIKIILENDLLFDSGKWEVKPEGENAVNALGDVLSRNPDVSIRIEGHTDNQPLIPNKEVSNNWDLSLKRAAAIVEVLRNNQNLNQKNLTAAGRGEYDPIADNSTEEGRAQNRRIEIILSPKLDELIELIKN
ncbi:OmpA family protein [Aquimarina mytili]|uniref:OmpA family protein n=1 Tax=Aquimarina mytili TaxID=874423 RepID=A0A936ZQG1_9FLAO|nr:OmpA family protein [Aquimarina mytili]MBL0683537.1 OmpA family protein [Aquimarina mytili]